MSTFSSTKLIVQPMSARPGATKMTMSPPTLRSRSGFFRLPISLSTMTGSGSLPLPLIHWSCIRGDASFPALDAPGPERFRWPAATLRRRALLGLVQVNVLLREREGDAFLVEALLDRLGKVEHHAPVVSRLDPGAYDEVDTAVCEFRDRNCRSRIGQDTFVGGD